MPTASLDFKNQALVLNIISKLTRLGLTIIMTSHFPNHALLCADRVALMNHKTLMGIDDTHTIMTEKNLKQTYEIDVKLVTVSDPKEGGPIKFCLPCVNDHYTCDFATND